MPRTRQPAHPPRGRRSTEGARRRLPRVTLGRIFGATAAVIVGTMAAVVAAGGSYAYLNASAVVGQTGAAVTAGTSTLLVQRGSDAAAATVVLPSSLFQGMLPGDVVNQTLTVLNTGDADLQVTAALTGTSAWETRVAVGACPSSGTLPGGALTTVPSASGGLAAGTSAAICLQVVLPATAPASAEGTTTSFSLVLTGSQA
ncbi:hypothetical protein [Homoserinibacter sp. GY 40078]|uniref:hypothetical protein n=1 Tax=Homoserinibacter sp. GY 40078 TaxID=2603275 RepID=UPI0011C882B9|nr:hypothetical protein [Homoserinibacter sp. GY 40078]TXK17067.1 hypothetical protein FVQ89_09310 [Homoserinibacter sp. GY 40078]